MEKFDFYKEYTYTDYDVFISSIKHELKRETPESFVKNHSEQPNLYMHAKILYLVATIEYLCNQNNLQRPEWINKYRHGKMERILFSESTILSYHETKDENKLIVDYNNCISEFKHHNLVETSLNNVF